jgi:hypothetical protein
MSEEDFDSHSTLRLEALLREAENLLDRNKLLEILIQRYRRHYESVSLGSGIIEGFFDSLAPLKVKRNDSIHGAGWAADSLRGSPVARVEVRIDGNRDGAIECSLTAIRPDVAAARNRPDYKQSGWIFSYIVRLELGTHSLQAFAYDILGECTPLNKGFFLLVTT